MDIKFIIVASFIVAQAELFAQTDQQVEIVKSEFKAKQVIPPSPDAAALGSYGNVPVSLFTGAPNISIPLMQLQGIKLSLPVSISYNSSGFRPEEIASWVGLGWAVNAGGVIIRSVYGNPDVDANYYLTSSPIVEPSSLSDFDRAIYFKDISKGFKETQPDCYFYNFLGRSGKFYITPGKLVLKKEADMMGVIYSADQFNVKDEAGNSYMFDEREVSSSIPDELSVVPLSSTYTSAWYLSSVTSASGSEKIVFEYYSPIQPQAIYQGALQQQSATWTYKTSSCSNSPAHTEKVVNLNSQSPTNISRKFLKKVSLFVNNTEVMYIDFESLLNQRQDLWTADFDGERMLEYIRMYSIHNGIPILCKAFKFFYSYFPTQQTASGGLRLRLDKVQELSNNPGTPDRPAHQFEYNPGDLPKRFSFGIDHWGYYNGANQNSLLPSIQASIDGSLKTYGDNADREPSLTATQLSLLKKITYPTGGYTMFEFEGHGASGGVRIKKIADFSFDGMMATAKSYSYSNQQVGNILRYDRLSNYSTSSEGCMGDPCDCPITGGKSITISSTSIYGLGFSRGTPVAYGKVTESITDANEKPIGKTIYHYEMGTPYEYDDDIRTGSLLKQEVFDNAGKLLKETTNIYSYSDVGSIKALRVEPEAVQNDQSIMCEKNVNGYLQVFFYKNLSGQSCIRTSSMPTKFQYWNTSIRQQWYQLAERRVKQYHQQTDDYLTTYKKYTYGSAHNNPILIEEVSSDNGDKIYTQLKYIGDYSYVGNYADVVYTNHKAMYNNNIKGIEVEKVQYRSNADGSNKRYVGGSLTTYNAWGEPLNIYKLDLIAPLSSFSPSTFVNGSLTYNSNYTQLGSFKYSSLQNLIEQSKVGDITTSYIWDYNSTFPVASVSNSFVENIAYSGFETNLTGGWSITQGGFSTNNFFTGNRALTLVSTSLMKKTFTAPTSDKQIVSYWVMDPSPLTVKANGVTVNASAPGRVLNGWFYYEHIAPAGTSSIDISATSATVDELRTYPLNSLMTTFNYDLTAGVTFQCDPNNKITEYQYDGLGRLVNIRDNQRNIIKSFKYNYGLGTSIVAPKEIYYNELKEQMFVKQNCPVGTYPTSVLYIVPYGKYSALTQAEANQLAQDEINNKGQQNANQNGLCMYKNVAKTTFFFRQCEYYQGTPVPFRYVVPEGTYSSPISQAAADQLAQDEINAKGQEAANNNGTCSCMSEGKRFINGTCETGVRINYSWVYNPSGSNYKCTYYYRFSDNSQSEYYVQFVSAPCVNN